MTHDPDRLAVAVRAACPTSNCKWPKCPEWTAPCIFVKAQLASYDAAQQPAPPPRSAVTDAVDRLRDWVYVPGNSTIGFVADIATLIDAVSVSLPRTVTEEALDAALRVADWASEPMRERCRHIINAVLVHPSMSGAPTAESTENGTRDAFGYLRWTSTSCRRCGYEKADCTCIGGFCEPQPMPTAPTAPRSDLAALHRKVARACADWGKFPRAMSNDMILAALAALHTAYADQLEKEPT